MAPVSRHWSGCRSPASPANSSSSSGPADAAKPPFSTPARDAQTRFLLDEQLQDLWMQTHKTILLVTHSVAEAVRMADRVIMLHAHPGRIRKEIQVTLAHPRDPHSADVAHIVRIVRREI